MVMNHRKLHTPILITYNYLLKSFIKYKDIPNYNIVDTLIIITNNYYNNVSSNISNK